MNRNRLQIVFRAVLLGLIFVLGVGLLAVRNLSLRQSRDAALEAAVQQSDLAAVRRLLREHADPNVRAPLPFSWAFWRKPADDFRPSALRTAIDRAVGRAAFDAVGPTSSQTLSADGHAIMATVVVGAVPQSPAGDAQEIVIALLDAGARVVPNDGGSNLLAEPLTVKAQSLTPLIKALISHGAPLPPTLTRQPLLVGAILNENSPATIDTLLQAGVDAKGATGRAALTAAYNQSFLSLPEREQILRSLLTAGADPNTPMDQSSTLLYDAVRTQQFRVVRLLLKAHADPNAVPSRDNPILDCALEDAPEVLQWLLDAGANPNAQESNGEPVLWYALIHRMEESPEDKARKVELLLAHGADVHTRFAVAEYCAITVQEAAHRKAKDWHIDPSLLALLDRAAEGVKQSR